MRSHRSVMVQMPTGTGKTYLLAAVVKTLHTGNASLPVWIVAHRRELVSQIQETLNRFFPAVPPSLNPVKESATPRSTTFSPPNIKVMSIQWLSRHLEEMQEEPSLIIIDEAHHAHAKTYKILWKTFPQTKILGLTATPCRLNGRGFSDLFEVLVQSWNIPRFISEGRLAAYDFVSIKPSSATQKLIDTLKKRGADGDYQTKEMDQVLNKKPSIERLYQSFCEFGKDRKGIVYAIDISHAKAIADYYCRRGVNAAAIDSKTPLELRKKLISLFRLPSGAAASPAPIQVLVNVDIFSEGFDCPDVEFVQLARPTLSLAKYLQMVGRGLRVARGKEKCVIIDNVGLYRVFGLPSRVWNWAAMFEGRMSKREMRETVTMSLRYDAEDHECATLHETDTEMMTVVTHEQLEHTFVRQMDEEKNTRKRELILQGGMGKVTVIGRELVKLTENNNSRTAYVDLLNMNYIEGKNISQPRVVREGGVEFLKYNRTLYSRTRTVVSVYYYDNCITDKGFYSRCLPDSHGDRCMPLKADKSNLGGKAAVFLHDEPQNVYWLSGELADGGIVIMDGDGMYYLAEKGKAKEPVGRCRTDEERKTWSRAVLGIVARADARAEERRKERISSIDSDDIRPYKVGLKWGMCGSGGRVVVPPIYRKVREENGFYPFEKLVDHWGVMDKYGKVLVKPEYGKVVITADGKALVSRVTGNTHAILLT